jgi:hypothetical protein
MAGADEHLQHLLAVSNFPLHNLGELRGQRRVIAEGAVIEKFNGSFLSSIVNAKFPSNMQKLRREMDSFIAGSYAFEPISATPTQKCTKSTTCLVSVNTDERQNTL